jgi:hypothetical protein
LCTSPDAVVRNPPEGLAIVSNLGAPEGLSPGNLDTVAACHAATSDFDAAVRLQALAVQRQEAFSDSPEVLVRMRTRLDGYRKKQTYVEKPEDE